MAEKRTPDDTQPKEGDIRVNHAGLSEVYRDGSWCGPGPHPTKTEAQRQPVQTHELEEALAKVREAEVLLDQAYDAYCDTARSEERSPEYDDVANRQWCIIRVLGHAIYDAMRTLEGRYGITVTIAVSVDRQRDAER